MAQLSPTKRVNAISDTGIAPNVRDFEMNVGNPKNDTGIRVRIPFQFLVLERNERKDTGIGVGITSNVNFYCVPHSYVLKCLQKCKLLGCLRSGIYSGEA